MKTKVWAHRGASAYAPENTLEAFRLAVDMKAEGVELDVHLSRDGELMVGHDETVDRCSDGTGMICEMTCSQLKALDFGVRFPQYRGAKMPTLEEVYRLLKPAGLFINIEIKSLPNIYEGIEQKLDDLASAMGMQDRIIYSSFDHYTLVNMRRINSSVPLGILYSHGEYEPWKYAASIGVNALHPWYPSLKRPVVPDSQAAGIAVHPWTVDGEQDLAWMYRLGVEAVITNKPDIALKVRGQVQG